MFRSSGSSKNFFALSRRRFSSVREPQGSNVGAYFLGGLGLAGMGFLATKFMFLN